MPTSYASERRDRKRAKRAENLALIAGLLGGIGQGISAFTQAGDRKEAMRQNQLKLDLEGEKLDETERANRAREAGVTMREFSRQLGDRAKLAFQEKQERRRQRLDEAKIAALNAKTSGGGGDLTGTQRNALGLAVMESGLDPGDSAGLEKYIKGEIEKASAPDAPIDLKSKDFLQSILDAPARASAARRKETRLKTMQTALGGLGQQRSRPKQPALGAAPEETDSGTPLDIDDKNENDLLGGMGALWGAAQQGVDFAHPALAPVWGILENMGFAVPQRVKVARQASMMPKTLGGMPAQGPPAPPGYQPR